ncbi:MAG: tRNA 2-thiouridine(34) synthase MnmA [Blautia sp.]|nr:tRNA 2-thiouridine(34) synthase MnmA [Blautia sp.]
MQRLSGTTRQSCRLPDRHRYRECQTAGSGRSEVKRMSDKRALIAMSGGVDSSVAAYLMKASGFECIGCTMKLYQNEDAGISKGHTCCSLDDMEDARSVARALGMPYYVFNFSDDFREKIIHHFIWSYEHGQTPNPCIDCNRYMKFDKLFDRAKILGCEFVVTGHYARIENAGGKYILRKAADISKDQSYVLCTMTQEQLAHTVFPLGEYRKTQIRQIAGEQGFNNSEKPDSQDICFVPDGDYARVIRLHGSRAPETGDFIDTDGNVIGTHRGIIRYTIGQRKGLGLSFQEPHYVCAVDAENNTVTLGTSEHLFKRELLAVDFNWISGNPPQKTFRCKAKIRYRQPEQWASVSVLEDGRVRVCFDEPQRAITPGQAAVLYDGDIVLGGGTIER